MELLIVLAIVVIVFLVIAIPVIVVSKIMDIYYNRKKKKFNEKHPKYIEFKKKFDEMQNESSKIWNSTMPDYRRAINHLVKEMNYYPEHSYTYQKCKNRLDIAREKINTCQEEYDKKEKEIRLFVQENKDVIEEIKDDDFVSYTSWIERYDL
jgi:hypothetical protein